MEKFLEIGVTCFIVFGFLRLLFYFIDLKSKSFEPPTPKPTKSDEPNVNDLDFTELECLVEMIEKVETDYQMKAVVRYKLLKKQKEPLVTCKNAIVNYGNQNDVLNSRMSLVNENTVPIEIQKESTPTLPKGFTIEYNEYEDVYYPMYEDRYLEKISRGKIYKWGELTSVDRDNKCKTEMKARRVIEEYNAVNLGNAVTRTIR